MEVIKRARGCILGHMIADALGAAIEGFPPSEIRALAQKMWGSNYIQNYIPAVHMGTFVPAGEPGTYREATNEGDVNFVPTGPPCSDGVRQQCVRLGMYTDDTNACLAVGWAIAERGHVDSYDCARRWTSILREIVHCSVIRWIASTGAPSSAETTKPFVACRQRPNELCAPRLRGSHPSRPACSRTAFLATSFGLFLEFYGSAF